MKNWIKWTFLSTAIYDIALGIGFVFAGKAIFAYFGVTPPNHMAYIHFPALLLIVFGLMFYQISQNAKANANLIPYGMGLKAAYSGTAFYYHFTQGVPKIWMPFAYIDLAYLVLFVLAWMCVKTKG